MEAYYEEKQGLYIRQGRLTEYALKMGFIDQRLFSKVGTEIPNQDHSRKVLAPPMFTATYQWSDEDKMFCLYSYQGTKRVYVKMFKLYKDGLKRLADFEPEISPSKAPI